MRQATTSALIAVVALACSGAPARRPTIGGAAPAVPSTVAPAEVEDVLDLGESYLVTRASWRQSNRGLASTDYDRGWGDLDGFQRQQYVEAARQVVELAEAVAVYEGALRARTAEIERYLDGLDEDPEKDPPGDVGHVVDRLLEDSGRVIERLARAATPASDGACLAARFALSRAIPDHGHVVEEARVTSEMGLYETGLPPGSAEQQEVVEEHARLMAELDDWEDGLARDAYALAAVFELAPLPVVLPPAEVVPEPIADDWAALERAIVAAREACADVTPARAD